MPTWCRKTGTQSPASGELPSLRCSNLLHFKQELTIDTYVDTVVSKAKLVVLRLLGGEGYYPHLFESVRLKCLERNIPALFLPGHADPDLELMRQMHRGPPDCG